MGTIRDQADIVELDPTTKIGREYPAGLKEARKTIPASRDAHPGVLSALGEAYLPAAPSSGLHPRVTGPVSIRHNDCLLKDAKQGQESLAPLGFEQAQ